VGLLNQFLEGFLERQREQEQETRVILRQRVREMSLGGTHFALAGLWQSIGLALGCRDLKRQAPL